MKEASTSSLIIRWVLVITLLFGILATAQIMPEYRAVGVEEITIGMLAQSFLFGLVIGIFVAFAQWLLLRYFSISAKDWLIATSIGFGFGWSLGLLADFFAMRFGSEYLGQGGPIAATAYGLTIAVSVAVSQYFLIRRKYTGAKVWFIVTFIGWAFAWWVSVLPLNFLMDIFWYFEFPVVGILFGVAFGAITGLGLVSLRKSEKSLAG